MAPACGSPLKHSAVLPVGPHQTRLDAHVEVLHWKILMETTKFKLKSPDSHKRGVSLPVQVERREQMSLTTPTRRMMEGVLGPGCHPLKCTLVAQGALCASATSGTPMNSIIYNLFH